MLQDEAPRANNIGQTADVYNDGSEDGPNQPYDYPEHDHCHAWDPADDYQHYPHDAEGAEELQHIGYPAHRNNDAAGGNDPGDMYDGNDVPSYDPYRDYPAHEDGHEPMHEDAVGGAELSSAGLQEWEADRAEIDPDGAPGTGAIPHSEFLWYFSTHFADTRRVHPHFIVHQVPLHLL